MTMRNEEKPSGCYEFSKEQGSLSMSSQSKSMSLLRETNRGSIAMHCIFLHAISILLNVTKLAIGTTAIIIDASKVK